MEMMIGLAGLWCMLPELVHHTSRSPTQHIPVRVLGV